MKQYQAEVNSKSHLVIPKEVRHQFHIVPGSKVKIEVEGERIILIPHTLVDAMEKVIVDTLKKAGLKPEAESLVHYEHAMKQAFKKIATDVADETKEDCAAEMEELKLRPKRK